MNGNVKHAGSILLELSLVHPCILLYYNIWIPSLSFHFSARRDLFPFDYTWTEVSLTFWKRERYDEHWLYHAEKKNIYVIYYLFIQWIATQEVANHLERQDAYTKIFTLCLSWNQYVSNMSRLGDQSPNISYCNFCHGFVCCKIHHTTPFCTYSPLPSPPYY